MISTTTNRVTYNGNGSSATFSFPYEFFGQTDLKVYLYNSSLQSASLQTLNTNYTVGGSANLQGVYTQGGSIIFASAVPTTHLVVITRDPSQVQNYSLMQNGQINSVALVQQLDYLTLLIQRLQDQANRALKLNEGHATTFDQTIPDLALTASTVLMVNSSATGWAVGPTADQIFYAQSAAISALLSMSLASAANTTANAAAVAAQSAAVSAGNLVILANSAATSVQNAASVVGSTAFWGGIAQSSALSATNQAVLSASAAVSAGNLVILANSAAISAGNSAATAAVSAAQASSSAGSISFPISTANGGTGTGTPYTYAQFGVVFMSSATQMAGTGIGGVGKALRGTGSSAPAFSYVTAPTITVLTSSVVGTYTTPVSCTRIQLEVLGGGGGGGSAVADGGLGGPTLFGSSVLNPALIGFGGNGGAGAGWSATGSSGWGGLATGGSVQIPGGYGQWGTNAVGAGGQGGNSAIGPSGRPGIGSSDAVAGSYGTGGSGSGGSISRNAGGAGGYLRAFISTPASSYQYTIGDGGAGGASNATVTAGAKGGKGVIIVTEFYD